MIPRFTLCADTGVLAVNGACPAHHGDACLREFVAVHQAILRQDATFRRLAEVDTLSMADAIHYMRYADDMLEWLARRYHARRVVFSEPDAWEYTITFQAESSHDEEPLSLRAAIERAMEKERKR